MIPTAPRFLREPCTVGLVTLGAPDPANNPAHVQRAIAWLKSRRVTIKWGANARRKGDFLAAAPERLAEDLHGMLADPMVDLVLTTGGGANANQILPHLDPDVLRKHPKPLIGLSNSTVFLNYLASSAGVVTFHGPVLVWNFGGEKAIDKYTQDHLSLALSGVFPITIRPERTWRWLRGGRGAGRAWGGNLWSFQQLVGTPYVPDIRGGVLFIEECFTELHNVEAVLFHLRQSGAFEKLSGLIVGVPLECKETEMATRRTFADLIMHVCTPFKFPIVAGVHLGHTDRKITIPIGAVAKLDSRANLIEFRGA